MVVAKTAGWFILLIPLMILAYNIPLSLVVSAYSKVRYGEVVHFPRMPCALVVLGMLTTFMVAGLMMALFDVDPEPIGYAAFLRSGVYAVFNY